jgi:hypothetical protein
MMNFLRSSGWIRQEAFNPEIQHFTRKSPLPRRFVYEPSQNVKWLGPSLFRSFRVTDVAKAGVKCARWIKMGWQSDTKEEHNESVLQ